MVTGSAAVFPRINLVRDHADRVVVSIVLPWTDDVPGIVSGLLTDDEFSSARKYRAGKTEHVVWESLVRRRRTGSEPDDLLVTVQYETRYVPPGSVPKFFRRENELLSRLDYLPEPGAVACHVDLRFEVVSSTAGGMWFPLPASVPSAGQDIAPPVDEIRGIRGVKKRGKDGVDYSFTLDRPNNGPIFLSIDFELAGRLTPQTPGKALARAREIARGLGVSA